MELEAQLEQFKKEFKLLYMSRRPLLGAILVLTVAFAVGYFLTYAEYDKISVNQGRNDSVEGEIESLRDQKQAWEQALSNPDYQQMSELVNEVLPSKKPIMEAIYIFDELLKEYPV